MNKTGVVVGRLSKENLRELLIRCDGLDMELREKLARWYEDSIGLWRQGNEDEKRGLVVSYP